MMTKTVLMGNLLTTPLLSSEAIFSDAWLMVGGYLLMFAYTITMLGHWNRVEVMMKQNLMQSKWSNILCKVDFLEPLARPRLFSG